MKALIISADRFEDTELLVPYYRLIEDGIEVDVISIKKGTIKGKHNYEIKIDKTLKDIDTSDYDLLIIPGGKAPEALRKDKEVIDTVKHFFDNNKAVSAICHGPQILITAGLLKGRHVTCYKSVAPEIKEAGANYEDKEVIVDGNLITSRQPSDLPAFIREIMKMLKR